MLFIGIVIYTLYLILSATEHDALPWFSGVMLMFFIPLTLVTLLVSGWRAFKGRSRQM